MISLGVALVIYVKTRAFLAVDQLVRIYREVSRVLQSLGLKVRGASLQAKPLDHLCRDGSTDVREGIFGMPW